MQGSLKTTILIGGVSLGTSRLTRSAGSVINHDATLPSGKAGTLTTRTDDNTGVSTLSSNHGISSQDVVDVYWSGGVRYGMTATVAVNAVTVDGGAGDNLPTQNTALVVSKQVTIDTDFAGDLVELAAVIADKRAQVEINNGSGALVAVDLTAGEAWHWAADTTVDNPLAGETVSNITASNGTTTAATLKVGILYDGST